MKEFDRRIVKDRRKQPTVGLTRYVIWGQRKVFRRKIDQQKGGYVDRYSSALFFFLLSIVGLNLLDAFLTIRILDFGGREANPIVRSTIELYGDSFWVWKYALVSSCLIFLCVHSHFRWTKSVIASINLIYFTVVLYQIVLLTY